MEEILLIIISDEVDGKTEVTKSSRSTNSVEVRLRVMWKVEINDDVN